MLVLSRKAGEEIRIGSDVVVTVQRLNGNRVSLGVEAPRAVKIVRGELPGTRNAELGTRNDESDAEAV